MYIMYALATEGGERFIIRYSVTTDAGSRGIWSTASKPAGTREHRARPGGSGGIHHQQAPEDIDKSLGASRQAPGIIGQAPDGPEITEITVLRARGIGQDREPPRGEQGSRASRQAPGERLVDRKTRFYNPSDRKASKTCKHQMRPRFSKK